MSDVIPFTPQNLSFKCGGRNCTLEFDQDYLTVCYRDTPELQLTKVPLWRIMPELLVDRSLPDSYRREGRVARYCLLGSIIAFFSDIQTHVPLLAPILLSCAAWTLFRAIRYAWPLDKTKIVSEWGEELAVIPHHDSLATARAAFEEKLLAAIRRARDEHYAA
jgi:hypothetical protein